MAIRDDHVFFHDGCLRREPDSEVLSAEMQTPQGAPESGFADHRSPNRLVGWTPGLVIRPVVEADGAPADELHALVMTANDSRAFAPAARFFLPSLFVSQLRHADVLRVARNNSAELAVAVHRNGELLVAVGALSALRLAGDVSVAVAWDIVEEMQSVAYRRDPSFRRHSLCGLTLALPALYEVVSGTERKLVGTRTRRLAAFDVAQVKQGWKGLEWSGPKGYIVRREAMPTEIARMAARLLSFPINPELRHGVEPS
ncbi:MAG: hypothetical protein U0P30_08970 [Vicinamibacterales bacterium]